MFQNTLDNIVYVDIDKHKMTQVIRNLLSNALKFSPPDGTIYVTMEIIDAADWTEEMTLPIPVTSSKSTTDYIATVASKLFPSSWICNNFLSKSSTSKIRVSVQDFGAGISVVSCYIIIQNVKNAN
jgi:signal transduction histidine kinase